MTGLVVALAGVLFAGLAVAPTATATAATTSSAAAPAPAATSTFNCVGPNPAVSQFRRMNVAQLDEAFKKLSAGPIPNGPAKGYAWADLPVDPIVLQHAVWDVAWRGKVAYHNDGTDRIYDRIPIPLLGVVQLFKGRMYPGISHIDGKPVTVLDFGFGFYDEIRMVQPGVYIGNSYTTGNGLVGGAMLGLGLILKVLGTSVNIVPNTPFLNVVLDFNCVNNTFDNI